MGIGVLVDIFKLPEGKTVICDALSPNDGKAMGEFLSVPLTVSTSAPLFNSPLSPGLTEVMTRLLGRHLPSVVPEG